MRSSHREPHACFRDSQSVGGEGNRPRQVVVVACNSAEKRVKIRSRKDAKAAKVDRRRKEALPSCLIYREKCPIVAPQAPIRR
jgi:hypothetical protein